MKQPLVAPLAALAAGIFAARFAEFTLGETLLSVALLALLAFAALRLRLAGSGTLACLTGFCLTGALLASLPRPGDPRFDPNRITSVLEREGADFGDPVRLRGWVREPPEDLGDADRFVLETESIFRDTLARGGIRVTVNRAPGVPPLRLRYGDRVEFLARLRHLHNFQNPGSFDFAGYMARQGIFVSAIVRPGVPILAREGRGGSRIQSVIWKARQWARSRFSEVMAIAPDTAGATPGAGDPEDSTADPAGDSQPGPNTKTPAGSEAGKARETSTARASAILDAMLLGVDDALDRQTTTDFQRTGTYHVLVVSGMQLGLFAFLILRLLRALGVPPGWAALAAILFGGAYALLVGTGVPVLRSAWMLAAYLATTLVYRQRRALNVIAGTALGFLAVDPDLLLDAGFQLSFSSVALIAAIAVPVLRTSVEPWRIAVRDIWNLDRDLHADPVVADHRVAIRTWLEPIAALTGLRRRWISHPLLAAARVVLGAAELIVVSLVVQAGLALPLAVHFQRISWSGVLANLLIIPLLSVAMPMGLLALLTGWRFAAVVSLWSTGWIAETTRWFAENLPLDSRVPPPPWWLAALLAVSLAMTAIACEAGRRRTLAIGLAALLIVVLTLHPFAPELVPGSVEMSAIDVGQGDSIFLALPGGQTMLVDGGGQPDFRDPDGPPSRREPIDIGEAVVSPYLWSRSIQRLDILAVTHADADHMGGIPALLRNFAVHELWLGNETFGPEYRAIRSLAASRGTVIRAVAEGQRFAAGGATIEVLGPPRPPSKGRNELSLVLCLQYGDQRFLLTGDIEQDRERTLVDSSLLQASTILKVAHHGSRTSSHELFLRTIQPVFAIISVGFENFYGHPQSAVLQRLADAHATILRTDQDGLISVVTDGHRLSIDTYQKELQRRSRRPRSDDVQHRAAK